MARAFVYGDGIDTDALTPGHAMKLTPEAMARHCLEAIDPAFAATVKPGDVLVAGDNFGLGSSREQAALSLKILGVLAVFARSFARIFYRNAINAGLPAIILPQAAEISPGDEVAFDLASGALRNLTSGRTYQTPPLPPHRRLLSGECLRPDPARHRPARIGDGRDRLCAQGGIRCRCLTTI